MNRKMHAAIGLVLLMALMLAPGCGKTTRIDEAALVPITWETNGEFDRAALMVPVTLGGQDVTLQLDTGASTCFQRALLDWLGIKYEVTAPAAGWDGRQDAFVVKLPELRIGSLTVKGMPTIVYGPILTEDDRAEVEDGITAYRATHPTGGLPCGTLGADFFTGRSLYLDFVAGKVGVLSKRAAIDGTTVPITLYGRRPVLDIEAPVKLKAMFDTGSSALQLVARADAFTELTGAVPGSDATGKLSTQSWGKDVSFDTADCSVELTVGPLKLPVTKVCTSSLVEQLSETTSGQADAVLGNEPFRHKIVLVNFARKTFTVADPK